MDKDDPALDSSPSAPTEDPLLGKVLNGKFRIVGLIGRGGMGKIYKAEQLSLGRMVAVKLLSIVDRVANVEEFRERFFREASLCARLSHPNIVTIHDYGSVEGEDTLLMAMEYLEGKNLMQRLKSLRRPLSPSEATAIVIEIARGIREAHKHGIVHRDLKCSNVMLVPDEDGATRIKILDFGLVKSLSIDEGDESLTVAGGGFLGSPGYMSPEQIQRGMLVDHRTDIYSLGVILFRCLAGRNPYEGDQAQVLISHVNSPLPTLHEANPLVEVPPALEAFMRRMLEKQAERRISSAEEVVRSLREIQNACGWTARSAVLYDNTASFSKPPAIVLDPTPTTGGSISPIAVTKTPPPKRRVTMALLGAAVLAGSLALLVRGRRPEPAHVLAPPAAVPTVVAAPAPAPAPPQTIVAPPPSAPEPVVAPAPVPPAPAATPIPPAAAPRSAVRRPSVKSKPVVAQAPIAATTSRPTAPTTGPAAAPVETGFLSLDTSPWSNVSDGGHALGQTPLIRVKLSEGQHTLTLTTERGVSKTFMVTIKAGQTVSKRLGLE